MTTTDKKRILYECILNCDVITTKHLNEAGLNSKDITKFIEIGELKRIKRGEYEFVNLESLYNYGNKFMLLKIMKKE